MRRTPPWTTRHVPPNAYSWSALPSKGEKVIELVVRAHTKGGTGPAEIGSSHTLVSKVLNDATSAVNGGNRGRVSSWCHFLEAVDTHITKGFTPVPCSTSLLQGCGGTAPSTVCAAAVLGDMMAVGVSQPGFIWLVSPLATELEALLCHWLVQAVGLPVDEWSWAGSNRGGMAMQNSTTEALMVAMLGARTRAAASRIDCRYAVYCASGAPTRVDKAARLLGFELVRRLANFTPEALKRAMATDEAQGVLPAMVVLCVGTSVTGTADNIQAFAADAEVTRRAWLHVDVGYSFFAACCPEKRAPFQGWEAADSIGANTGSWLPVGVNSAMLFFRDRASIAASLNATGSYLDNPHTATGTVVDFKDFHLGLGRTFRALKCYTTWKVLGAAGVAQLVRRHGDAGSWIESRLAAHLAPDVRVVPAQVPGVVTLVGHSVGLIAERLRSPPHHVKGLHVTRVGDQTYLRLVLHSNHFTSEDVGELVQAVLGRAVAVDDDVTPPLCLPLAPWGASTCATQEFRIAARQLLVDISELHQRLSLPKPSVRILSAVKPGFIRDVLPTTCPSDALCSSLTDLVADFNKLVVPTMTHWHHRKFYAFFPAMVSPAGLLGDMLGLATHQTLATAKASPVATQLEVDLCQRLPLLYGLPNVGADGFGCVLQPSATEAMLVMMRTALHRMNIAVAGKPAAAPLTFSQFVAYYTEDSHFCAEKAARVLGVRHRKVPSKVVPSAAGVSWDNTEVDVDQLRLLVQQDTTAGLHPFFVSVSVGATGTCAIDDLVAVRAVCGADIWMNVDAAYAGTAALCPEYQLLFKGWEAAESILVNATKWGSSSFNANVAFCKHMALVAEAIDGDGASSNDMKSTHLGDSQASRALKMLCVLQDFGVEGIQASVRRHIALAQYVADALNHRLGATKVHVLPPKFGLICFAVEPQSPQVTQRVVDAIHHKLGAFVVTANIKSKLFIRISFAHPAVDISDADELVDVICDAIATSTNVCAASKL